MRCTFVVSFTATIRIRFQNNAISTLAFVNSVLTVAQRLVEVNYFGGG
jgi:hypothetical protein